MTSHIGDWAHRPDSRSHLIESEVADRFVMRCGKEMKRQLGEWDVTRLMFTAPSWSNPACLQCAGGKRNSLLLNEDGQ